MRQTEAMQTLFTSDELRAALGADLLAEHGGSTDAFSGITNDSRVTRPGEVFVALKTEARDGHDFVGDAVANGATGVVIGREMPIPNGIAVFRVRDTAFGLGEIARYHRRRFLHLRVVVVTGNVGKTTTKEVTAALLGRRFSVLKSKANFNDNIGVAMMVLAMREGHERAVLEVGMDHAGEIARSCEIAGPDTAVVLNVGPTHMEALGSIEAIAAAKAEAVEAIGPHGSAVLNADDPYVAAMASKAHGRVITFGIEKSATIRATDVRSRGLGGVDFTLNGPGRALPTHNPLPGTSLVYNALAGIAVAFDEGFSLEEAAHALTQIEVPRRLQVRLASNGATILDDVYNAGPASMLAALGVLAETPGRRIAFLGDMLELGAAEAEAHRRIGEHAAGVVDALYTTGKRGRLIAEAARLAGAVHVEHIESKDEAARFFRETLGPGDVLLIKASHGLALHTVVEELMA
jgi:UDP-N-acetylmuramoyl-tripeptide--D-alanyl-D-alanine ligase